MKVIKSYSLDKEVADWLAKGEYTTASKKLNAIVLQAMRNEDSSVRNEDSSARNEDSCKRCKIK